jgi:hypothetical protein
MADGDGRAALDPGPAGRRRGRPIPEPAQLAGPQQVPVGMNAPGAEQNAQFCLNVVRWLTGVIPGS